MTKFSTPTRHNKAFTLLEISVVLVLISLVLGGGITILTASIQQSQYNATVATMQSIDDAILKFRFTNNRLPCPGDLTIAHGNTGYGLEAGTLTPGITANTVPSSGVGNGACNGTITVSPLGPELVVPHANFIVTNSANATQAYSVAVEGAVPTRALELPDNYMFDGWGNHIRYAVDVSATANNTFIKLPNSSLNSCGPITVYSSAGTARTTTAIYSLLSHGANGFGAYTQNGTASALVPGNPQEQVNCHLSSGACNGTYSASYVQQLPRGTKANSATYFDDIVSFKERWQLLSSTDSNPPTAPGNGLELVTAQNSSPGFPLYAYQLNGSVFSYVNNSPTPGSNVYSVAFSPDNSLLAVGGGPTGGSNGLQLYTTSGGLQKIAAFNPGLFSSYAVRVVGFSPDGRLLAVTHGGGSKYFSLFQPMQSYTNPLNAPTFPGGAIASQFVFSPDGQYFAILAGSYIWTYSVNCTTLTLIQSVSYGANYPGIMSFSNDGKYLAVSGQTVTHIAWYAIYKNSAGSLTALGGLPALPSNATLVTSIAFSHNGNILALTTNSYPYLFLYLNNRDDTFTALPPISVSAGANANQVAWSADDQYIAVANGSGDTGDVATTACGVGYHWCGLALYQVDGVTVNALPAVAPTAPLNTTLAVFPN